MSNQRLNHLGLLLAVLMLTSAVPLNAAIIMATVNNGTSQSFYDGNISATDLINSGSASFGSFTTSVPSTFGVGGGIPGTHNGNGTNTSGLGYWGGSTTVDLTYNLAGSASGYDITSINSIYGWQDSRGRHAAQRFSVFVATVANPTFTLLTSVTYDPFSDSAVGSTQVTLTDSTGKLATGVTAILFRPIDDPGDGTSEVGVIREYDVFGAVTIIPEPSHAFLSFASLLAFFSRRQRHP